MEGLPYKINIILSVLGFVTILFSGVIMLGVITSEITLHPSLIFFTFFLGLVGGISGTLVVILEEASENSEEEENEDKTGEQQVEESQKEA